MYIACIFLSKKKNHKKVLFHQFKIYFYLKKDILSLCNKTTYKIKCIYVVLQYIITGCLYKCSDVDFVALGAKYWMSLGNFP